MSGMPTESSLKLTLKVTVSILVKCFSHWLSSLQRLVPFCISIFGLSKGCVTVLPESPRLPKTRESDIQHPKINGNQKYFEIRDRKYLLESEVTAIMKTAKKGRWGHRDSTLIVMGYRHGLRISEILNLRSQQVDFKNGHLHVKRLKGSRPATHLIGSE
jgi:type 1 fimbriae regulatory protein FimB/type 1 fimbriae regulatory protein FimE